ncbi:MAG: BTAD domain-containing putative transcriptional regulator [Acidimicrobiia bacterium]
MPERHDLDRVPRYRVLGPLRVMDSRGNDVTPRGALQRRLLAGLLVSAGRVVPADRLADLLWPDSLPDDHTAALQTHVFRLRRALPAGTIVQQPPGYRMDVGPGELDSALFERLVTAAATERASDPETALRLLDEALHLWRGEPYDDLAGSDDGTIEAARLSELRLRAEEERFAALSDLEREAGSLADLDAFVARHPLRERPRLLFLDALDRSGRRVDALRVYDDYRRVLAEELGVEPSAAMRERHDALVAGGIGPRSAAEVASSTVGLVPRPVSSLVGREDLVEQVDHLLGSHRIVTLIGPGGVGKTRLAAEVSLRRDEAAAVWFCELASSESAGVAAVVAATLGLEERSDGDLPDRIAAFLRHQDALLVFDNCEHVLDGVAALTERVLARTTSVRVLATSRERLAVDGEQLCPVRPLDVAPAVRLFVERARSVRPDFRLDESSEPIVDEICRRLDGLPLAIELAAARLQVLDVADVRDGLDRRFSLLVGGRRTTPRHQSLAAALSWSYALLDEDDRRLLEQVSIFAGAFTIEAAAAVSDRPSGDVGARLVGLAERSLVQRVPGRFALLETVREFAAERLDERGSRDSARQRHAGHVLDVAEAAQRELGTDQQGTVLAGLDQWLADLRLAFRHFVETEAADSALRLVVAVRAYGLTAMRPEVLGWGEAAAALGRASSHPLVADALAVAALGAWKRGDLVEARRLVDEAYAALPPGASASGVVLDMDALCELGEGRLEHAAATCKRALLTADAETDVLRWSETVATELFARAYLHEATVAADAARLLAELSPDHGLVPAAWCWYAAGEAVLDDDPDLAKQRLRHAIGLALRAGNNFVAGISGASAASLEVRHGDARRAVQEYQWLLPLWSRAGVRVTQWTMLRSVAELLARLGADRAAAVVLGAVTAPTAGNEVVGDDADRLAALATELRQRLGHDGYEVAVAEGRGLDDDDAAAVALAVFDTID